jgi:hypothetical protein
LRFTLNPFGPAREVSFGTAPISFYEILLFTYQNALKAKANIKVS